MTNITDRAPPKVAMHKSAFRQTTSIAALATSIGLAAPALADPAVFFNANQSAGEQTFIATAAAADAAYNAANPGANQVSTIFRIDLTNSTGSSFAVTQGGTTVYVRTTRAGSPAANSANGDEGGNGFTNWSVNYTRGDFNSAINAGYNIAFFADSSYTTAYNVNAVGLDVSDWGTCCTTNNTKPDNSAANASQIYMLFNGSTPLLVGGISTAIAGEEHFVAAIDDRNSFSSVTLVPNGVGEAFGAGGILTFSTLQLNSVPGGSSVVTVGTPVIPEIVTGSPSTISQLIAGSVLPVFDGGTLSATSSATLSTNFSIRNTNGTIDTGANDLTLSGVISNVAGASGSLTKTGTGVLTLSGANSYAGGTTVSGGTLRGTTTSLQGPIVDNATVEFVQNSAGTYAGAISGTGALIQSGTGILTLTGTNSYTGATSIAQGATLALGGAGSVAASSGVTANGTFDITGHSGNAAIRTLDGSGTVALGANSLALSNAGGTMAGSIGGTGGLTIAGGNETLTGVNSYTGTTAIAQGTTLSLGGAGSVAASSGVTANGTFAIAGHSGDATIRTLDGTGAVALGANGLILSNAAGTMAGSIGGTGGLTVAGGSETLTGTNSYTGATSIASGATLALGGTGSLASSSGVITSGTLNIASHSGDVTIRTLSGTGTAALGANGLILTNAAGTMAGSIAGTGGLIVTGGSETLTGINSYTGATSIAQGATLALGGAGSVATSSGVTADGTFDIAGHNGDATIRTLGGTGTAALGANSLILTNAAGTMAGGIAGTGGLGVTGGSETLTGTNSYTGATSIAQGATLALGGAGSVATSSGVTANGTFDVAGHSGDATIRTLDGAGAVALGANGLILSNAAGTMTGSIGGTGGLTVAGGSETLTGTNGYTGATSIAQGATLMLGGAGSLANSSGLTANGTFDIGSHVGNATIRTLDGAGTVTLGTNDLILTDAAGTMSGDIAGTGGLIVAGGSETLTGVNSYSGATSIVQGATLALGGAGSVAASSGVTANGTFDITGHSGDATIGTLDGSGAVVLGVNGLILSNAAGTMAGSIGGTGGLTVAGGSETLAGTNSYTGATSIAQGATLAVTGGNALSDASAVHIDGTLRILSSERAGPIDGAGLIELAAGTLTTANDTDTSFAGTISGPGGFTKMGAATLVLGGNNDFTGGLNISQGAVQVSSDANLGGGTVSIDAATLKTSANIASGKAVILSDASAAIDTGQYNVVLSGNVSGNGTLNKIGTGTLTLTGTNSQNGITVKGGTLAFNSDAALGAAGGAVTIEDNTTLRTLADMTISHLLYVDNTKLASFDTAGHDVTMAGNITGAGIVQKIGAGTLTLTGSNTQVVIEVIGGNVLATQQSAVGASGGDIYLRQDSRFTAGSDMSLTQRVHVTGTDAVFDTGANEVTLLGAADGSQCLIKRGAGRLNMTADSSNAIGACVQQGILSFNSTFVGNVWVDPTGTAGGSGNIVGGMEVRGTLAPGNSPGRLVVAGNVTQFAGSTFAVDVDGRTAGIGAGHFDTLVLTGNGSTYTAAGTIAPKLRGITGSATNTFVPVIGDLFPVVTAEGAVTGSYASLTQPTDGLAANTQFDVLYMRNAVVLTLTAKSYANLFGTDTLRNVSSIGAAVDAFRGPAGVRDATASGAFLTGLMRLDQAGLARTLEQASGEIYADAMDSVVQTTRLSRAGVSDRLNAGFDATATGGALRANGTLASRLWGTFASDTQHIDGDRYGQKYRTSSRSMTIGADRNVSPNAIVGLGVSYNRARAVTDYLGTGRAQSYQAFAYAQWIKDGFFANGLLSGSMDRYKINRSVQLADATAQLEGKPHGFSAGGDIEIGKRIAFGRSSLTPAAGLSYDHLKRNALVESGSAIAALQLAGDRRDAVQARVGARLATSFDLGSILVRPYGQAFVTRELADASATISPTLYGRSFSVRAANAGRNAFRGNAGVSADLAPAVTLYASYRYGDASNAHSNAYLAGISIRW